jgi:hypothetical protein
VGAFLLFVVQYSKTQRDYHNVGASHNFIIVIFCYHELLTFAISTPTWNDSVCGEEEWSLVYNTVIACGRFKCGSQKVAI